MPETKQSSDIPVTQKMLNDKVQEINHRITSVSLDVKKLDASLNSRIELVETGLNSKIEAVDNKVDILRLEMKSGNEMLLSELRKMSASNEEVNSRNKYVLDGYAIITERQDRHEAEVKKQIKDIKGVISIASKSS